MRAYLTDLVAATALLTRIPMPAQLTSGTDVNLPRSVWAYPVVGAAVGACGALVLWTLAKLGLPILLAAGLAVCAQVLITGALHEDGLADVADGFGGGRDAAHKLEIMRDSRLGTYGAIALLLVIGLRWGAVASIPIVQAVVALVVAAALGRFAIVVMLAALASARSGGLGATVADPPAGAIALAVALTVLAAFALLPAQAAVVALALAGGATALMIWLAARQVGGYTGDVLGAGALIAETTALIGLAAVL